MRTRAPWLVFLAALVFLATVALPQLRWQAGPHVAYSATVSASDPEEATPAPASEDGGSAAAAAAGRAGKPKPKRTATPATGLENVSRTDTVGGTSTEPAPLRGGT
jgi:hypothetical protein